MPEHATSTTKHPWELSATELAQAMQSGRLTSCEILESHLGRIEAIDGRVRAFTEVLYAEARAQAKRADAERKLGHTCSPLQGLPISVKECLAMTGKVTTAGIPARKAAVTPNDAAMITLLKEAGAVLIGRTNLSQNMIYAESSNSLFGATSNPFSSRHTPGGSSGGEGAAVASGMSALGVGTDIGGSVRIPAAFCGLYGLMPTLDRWPLWGSVPGIPGQESIRGVAGPLARTAADLRLLTTAFDPARAAQLDPRTPPLSWAPKDHIRGKVFGKLVHDGVLAPATALSRALDDACAALEARGARIVPYRSPLFEEATYLYLAVMSADGAKTLLEVNGDGPFDAPLQGLLRIAKLPRTMRLSVARVMELKNEKRAARSLRAMGEKPVAELWKLQARMRQLRAEVLNDWAAQGLDGVVCPPGATSALPHGGSRDFALGMTYTFVWNLLHFPAGIAPVTTVRADETRGRSVEDRFDKLAAAVDNASVKLPAGVQIVARPYHDELILDALDALDAELRPRPDYPITPRVFA
jgi:fatty acid amide hydrolase